MPNTVEWRGLVWDTYYPAANGGDTLQVLVNGNTVVAFAEGKGDPDWNDEDDTKWKNEPKQSGLKTVQQSKFYRTGVQVCEYACDRVWIGDAPPLHGSHSTLGNSLLLEIATLRRQVTERTSRSGMAGMSESTHLVYISGVHILMFNAPGRVREYYSENVSNDVAYPAAITTRGALFPTNLDGVPSFVPGVRCSANAANTRLWAGRGYANEQPIERVIRVWEEPERAEMRVRGRM